MKWRGRSAWLNVLPRTGFLIHPSGKMMKTPSDKAVTNQSHCESRRTVRDISGQSSHTLVRRGRAVTADSHAAPFSLQSHRKAFCSFCPSQSCSFPNSLSFLSSFRHASSCLRRPDRGTHGTLIGLDRWLHTAGTSGVTTEPVRPVVVTKADGHAKHTHPWQSAPLLPACQNVHQQWHWVKSA